MGEAKTPPGCVALFIDEHGRVIAEVTDFETQGYGGFTLKDAQRIRCQRSLAFAVCNAYASEKLVRAISPYRAEDILSELTRMHGCRTHYIYPGHEEPAPSQKTGQPDE